jgi:hypothetical protein
LPRVLLAAAQLAADDVSFILVGSAALWLRGWRLPVGDVDLVIEPDDCNLAILRVALSGLAIRPRQVPSPIKLTVLHVLPVMTSFGKLDCMLERGRLDWHRLRRSASPMLVTDVTVEVAGAADALALRRRFRE